MASVAPDVEGIGAVRRVAPRARAGRARAGRARVVLVVPAIAGGFVDAPLQGRALGWVVGAALAEVPQSEHPSSDPKHGHRTFGEHCAEITEVVTVAFAAAGPVTGAARPATRGRSDGTATGHRGDTRLRLTGRA